MWDDGIGVHVAGVFVACWVLAADGVAHSVAEVDACVAETDAGEGGREEHFGLGFVIVRVFGGAGEVFDCLAEGLQGEDVGDGVRALVGGSVDGVEWARRAVLIGDCGPGFETVAEDVEAGGGVDGGGHGAGV